MLETKTHIGSAHGRYGSDISFFFDHDHDFKTV